MSAFVHASIWHLVSNLVVLVWLTPRLFRALDLLRLLLLIFAAQVGGLLAQVIADQCAGVAGGMIGASAIAAGSISAATLLSPAQKYLRLFALMTGGIAVLLVFIAPRSPVAHAAHLGGMLGGALAVWAIQHVSPGRRGAPRCKVRQE